MLAHLHHMETIAAIQEGMASAERDELKPAAQVLDEMRAKLTPPSHQCQRKNLGLN